MVDNSSYYWRKCPTDGIITPPFISSAVEGIKNICKIDTFPIVIGILFILFTIPWLFIGWSFFRTDDAPLVLGAWSLGLAQVLNILRC
jgi:hypothetical protein